MRSTDLCREYKLLNLLYPKVVVAKDHGKVYTEVRHLSEPSLKSGIKSCKVHSLNSEQVLYSI